MGAGLAVVQVGIGIFLAVVGAISLVAAMRS